MITTLCENRGYRRLLLADVFLLLVLHYKPGTANSALLATGSMACLSAVDTASRSLLNDAAPLKFAVPVSNSNGVMLVIGESRLLFVQLLS